MIRPLRRWLLGADPDGPRLRDDPLYRWEVRRYWTARRYAWLAGALAVWWGLAGIAVLPEAVHPGNYLEGAILGAVSLSVLGRLPLELAAAIGGAQAIAPERASGELEQLVLTPLDPWRVCRARYAARMRGILRLWAAAGAVMLLGWPLLVIALSTDDLPPASVLLMVAILAALHLDWGLMLLLDGASGLRFTAAAKGTAAAVARALLHSFLTIPFMQLIAVLCGQIAGMTLSLAFGRPDPSWLWAAGAILLRIAVSLVVLRDDLAYARQGTERIFLQPEDAA